MKKILFFLALFVSLNISEVNGQGLYPTHWWVGMKNPKLQLMIHHDKVGNYTRAAVSHPGVSIERVNQVENKNYLFIDIRLAPTTRPGTFNIRLTGTGSPMDISYTLKARTGGNGRSRVLGVTSSDVIYLIMPDRFANGDVSNDKISGLRDTLSDRVNKFSRHGGDLKGIQDRLGYFNELGVTALWLTPVLENNMPLMNEGGRMMAGYHGYWFTDHYQIDKRFGGNEAYKNLVNSAHQKGIKIIQDAVYNHVGEYHWFVLDPPSKDWLNQWPTPTGPNHREEVFIDPHSSAADKDNMLGGWFVPHLPDLNLRNIFLQNYLIQNAIWASEEFGIDGWRVDTYKYCYEPFMNSINEALEQEFPSITIFGEAVANTVTASAYFVRNNIDAPFKHNAQGVTDFPICYAMINAVNQNFGWTSGSNQLYMALSQDLLYKNPLRNCIFLDNHDMDRIYSVLGEDMQKMKMSMALLLTERGIPQLYYGTEILMKNKKDPTDAEVRWDFPGGFPGDAHNKFEASGRTAQENELFNYVKTFNTYRKNSSALKTGKLMQFIPQNGVYVYFRYDNSQTVMCVLNTNENSSTIDLKRFTERIKDFTKAYDVATGNVFELQSTLNVGGKYLLVMELRK